MAITFVGSNASSNSASAGVTVPLPAMNQNDLVLVFTGAPNRTSGVGVPSTAGYTTLAEIMPASPELAKLHVSQKFMGTTPDPSVTVAGGAKIATCVLIFRGVDTTAPIDVAIVSALFYPVGVCDPAPITPVNNNCCIVAACYSAALDTSVGSISNYLPSPSVQISCTSDTTVAAVYRILAGGASVAEDPLAWSTWAAGGSRVISATIALRPQAIDFVVVDPATVTVAGKAIVERETLTVSKAAVAYAGKTINIPDAKVEAIFVDKYRMVITGKTVEVGDILRAVTVDRASVLYRGRAVTPRDIQFENIPRYTVRGRGSGHWMETR